MKVLLFSICLTILSVGSFAQHDQVVKVKDVKGQAVGGINMSPQKVIDKAIKNAKLKALSKAGIKEQISTYQNLYRSETSEDYEEIFMSDVFSNIRGVVSSVQLTDTTASFNNKGFSLKVRVTIDAEVIKYKKKQDRTFEAWVKGIDHFYKNDSALQFSILPTKDCYARVFLIASDQEPYTIYPNSHEKDALLSANQATEFPRKKVDYILATENIKEPHRLIIVLVKEQIPYTGSIDYKPILDWIFSISPDKRVVKSFGFTVIKN